MVWGAMLVRAGLGICFDENSTRTVEGDIHRKKSRRTHYQMATWLVHPLAHSRHTASVRHVHTYTITPDNRIVTRSRQPIGFGRALQRLRVPDTVKSAPKDQMWTGSLLSELIFPRWSNQRREPSLGHLTASADIVLWEI